MFLVLKQVPSLVKEFMEIKKFKKGEVISKEGSFEPFMYVLNYGKVGSYLEYGTEEQRIIEIDEGQNALVGENGMFLSKPRNATFVALEDTEANIVTLDTISEYFAGKQSKVVEMLQKMCEKNEHLSEVFGDACRAMSDYIQNTNSKDKPGIFSKMKRFFNISGTYNKK